MDFPYPKLTLYSWDVFFFKGCAGFFWYTVDLV